MERARTPAHATRACDRRTRRGLADVLCSRRRWRLLAVECMRVVCLCVCGHVCVLCVWLSHECMGGKVAKWIRVMVVVSAQLLDHLFFAKTMQLRRRPLLWLSGGPGAGVPRSENWTWRAG